jgi:hypothetical protein
VKKTGRRRQTDVPQHIADAIREAWPDGVIGMLVDWDDALFWKVYPNLPLSSFPKQTSNGPFAGYGRAKTSWWANPSPYGTPCPVPDEQHGRVSCAMLLTPDWEGQ